MDWINCFLLLFSAVFTDCYVSNINSDTDFDLLIFTQHWPITVCQEWEEKGKSHSCSLPHDQEAWTIHGIWPTRNHTMGPFFCNKTWPFQPQEIRSIEKPMHEMWINIEKDTSTYSLWAHEWTKHGTCAAQLPYFDSQLKYFSMGLKWLQEYTMKDILNEAGIVPSNDVEYKVIDIHNAIKSKLKVDPIIECRSHNDKSYIFELRICFDKKLNLFDCDEGPTASRVRYNREVSVLTNCEVHKGISYLPKLPAKDSSDTLVQLYKLVTWLHWLTL